MNKVYLWLTYVLFSTSQLKQYLYTFMNWLQKKKETGPLRFTPEQFLRLDYMYMYIFSNVNKNMYSNQQKLTITGGQPTQQLQGGAVHHMYIYPPAVHLWS